MILKTYIAQMQLNWPEHSTLIYILMENKKKGKSHIYSHTSQPVWHIQKINNMQSNHIRKYSVIFSFFIFLFLL